MSDMTFEVQTLLDAYRQEFLAECRDKGFTPEEAAECLRDFDADTLLEQEETD